MYLIECLGFIINNYEEVGAVPSFLELTLDTMLMQLKLPGEKLKKICAEARKLEREGRTSARTLSRLIGKINATSQVCPLVLPELTNEEQNFQNYDSELIHSQEDIKELKWWDNHRGIARKEGAN